MRHCGRCDKAEQTNNCPISPDYIEGKEPEEE